MAQGLSATAGEAPALDIVAPEGEALGAPLNPAFDYTRSTGPILGAFFAGLRDGHFVGSRDARGTVHVPPVEFDAVTRAAVTELVDVADRGEVRTWTWVARPGERQVLQEPHALALIRLDGADTSLLHVVAAESADRMSTGMRVRAVWRGERTGSVRDLYFVPEEAPSEPTPPAAEGAAGLDDSGRLLTPVDLAYTHTAGFSEREFLRGLVDGKIIGRRRSDGPEVYVPPRDRCPADGVPMGEYVEVADVGTVTTFGIVNVPFAGQKITPPYVTAYILLDGADLPIQHLVLGCDAADVRMGMRVRAVWRPAEERTHSMASISHFEPTGEADADPDTYSRHL